MTVTLDLAAAASDAQTKRVLSDLSLAVAKRKKIVLVTGAGISCSCGIPDFRSSDGLYNLVKERYPDVVLKGKDLFDASLFRDSTSTSVFFSFIAELKKKIDVAKPSATHHFIKTLDSKNKLLRSYTQNIDGLEERVGLVGCAPASADVKGKGKATRLKAVRNVQLHGDIHRGVAPGCPECTSRSEARVARSARALRVGSLRPAIVLYDEPHPLGDDIGEIQTTDLSKKPDMLIIMGTSLKVHGLKKLVKEFAKTIHASTAASSNATSTSAPSLGRKPFKVIFVNKTPPSSEWSDYIDYHVQGDSDTWVNRVIEDWKRMRPADWEIQQTLSGELGFKAAKPTTVAAKKASKKKDENAPPDAIYSVANPPSSPGKRRQKSTHYDDLDSSPSKRQSVAPFQGILPPSERKMLFSEATNTIPDPMETSRMDISIVDLSMQDLESEVLKDLKSEKPKTVEVVIPPRKKAVAAKTSRRAAPTKKAATAKPTARRRGKAAEVSAT
ncbi:hst3 protein [Coprinopsis cinerea okayama7|uniref:Hst3 protein n=1 Tax=Coprinopsis cinerea (strain Okayama-7 / 130 / ATCC MYA-4618 / FGSC 9003) TaxID=240176 RepID=A8N9A9_COPC7|nr:hst3 protein [Coprinopsis cinerea okayama7\|eukprot:XP_001831437.2 hst3 protein [Coprinopsis cinerea okayama7\